jgi:hypothetical protein
MITDHGLNSTLTNSSEKFNPPPVSRLLMPTVDDQDLTAEDNSTPASGAITPATNNRDAFFGYNDEISLQQVT